MTRAAAAEAAGAHEPFDVCRELNAQQESPRMLLQAGPVAAAAATATADSWKANAQKRLCIPPCLAA